MNHDFNGNDKLQTILGKSFPVTSHLLMIEAERRGWKTEIIDYGNRLVAFFPEPEDFYRPRDPKKIILCQRTASELSTAVGQIIAKEKMLTYALASYYDIPIPESLFYTPEETSFMDRLSEFLRKHQRLVVKPTDCSCGRGVSINVTDMKSFQEAIDFAKEYSKNIVIQSYAAGVDYRLLVLNGHVIAASRRRPAFVVGDGERTILQLIELKHAHPWRGKGPGNPLKLIDLNEVEAYLGREQLESIPEKGREISLVGVANVSRGGESEDVLDVVHESIRHIAEKITDAAQLGLCGVDLMIDGDISKPVGPDCKVTLIEINGEPMIGNHHFPSYGGHARNVAGAILDEIVRRRKLHTGINNIPLDLKVTQNGETYFAPIVSNPEQFLTLSEGEKNYYAKTHN